MILFEQQTEHGRFVVLDDQETDGRIEELGRVLVECFDGQLAIPANEEIEDLIREHFHLLPLEDFFEEEIQDYSNEYGVSIRTVAVSGRIARLQGEAMADGSLFQLDVLLDLDTGQLSFAKGMVVTEVGEEPPVITAKSTWKKLPAREDQGWLARLFPKNNPFPALLREVEDSPLFGSFERTLFCQPAAMLSIQGSAPTILNVRGTVSSLRQLPALVADANDESSKLACIVEFPKAKRLSVGFVRELSVNLPKFSATICLHDVAELPTTFSRKNLEICDLERAPRVVWDVIQICQTPVL
jgi:hypothetical protein